jgi:Spy/CpxP family protein refolding chaperone
MKTQWLPWMASALILVVPAVPSVAKAETNSLTHMFPALVGVELTPLQQTQLQNLSKQTLPRVRRQLNPEQKAQFNSALSQGKGVRVALMSLKLSIGQQLQIRKILQPLQSEISSILTPEQQRQVQQNMQALQQQGR